MENEKLIIAIKAAADAASAESEIRGPLGSAFCRGKSKALTECARRISDGIDAKIVANDAAEAMKKERKFARWAAMNRKLRKSTYQYLRAGMAAGYREAIRLIGESTDD